MQNRATNAGVAQGIRSDSLERVRHFFDRLLAFYASQGYLGSLLGLLGQELAVASTAFRRRIEEAFDNIARRLAESLEEARARGDLPQDTDPTQTATFMVNTWEGAALRSRLARNAAPLEAALEATFRAALT